MENTGQAPQERRRKSVLVIEDDDVTRKLLVIEFKRRDYEVLEFADAAAAMAEVEKTKPRIDAAVVDLMNMGYGGNFGDTLRKHTIYRPTMVIYYSALSQSQFNRKILDHPNTHFIHKAPGSIKLVMEKIESAV